MKTLVCTFLLGGNDSDHFFIFTKSSLDACISTLLALTARGTLDELLLFQGNRTGEAIFWL
jgi:hypothetical protein